MNFTTKNGFVETISNIFYIPDFKSNLLSVGQLQEKGYVITTQNSACKIYYPSRGAIAVVQMNSNMLFPLKIKNAQPYFMVELKDPSWLWHFYYNCLNFGGRKLFNRKIWLLVFLKMSFPLVFVKNVLLANNIIRNSLKEVMESKKISWK